MSLRLEHCQACGKAYMLEQYSPAFARSEARGIVKCPHCDHERPADPNFVYAGHKLPRDSQA